MIVPISHPPTARRVRDEYVMVCHSCMAEQSVVAEQVDETGGCTCGNCGAQLNLRFRGVA
jgi:hypothetical protein